MRELRPATESLEEGESIWLPDQREGGWGIVYSTEGVPCRMLWFPPMTDDEIAEARRLAASPSPTEENPEP